jgi:hypothetical protein
MSVKAIFSQVSNYFFIKSNWMKFRMIDRNLLSLSWNEFCDIVTKFHFLSKLEKKQEKNNKDFFFEIDYVSCQIV